MPREYNVVDDFGRRHKFRGSKLVGESTDSATGSKPQWVELDVWRTEGGNFVVRRTTMYRVRHIAEGCPRADGYVLVDAKKADNYPCQTCNKAGTMVGGLGQAPRITVDAYRTPQELIDSFAVDGRYNALARSVLAEVADQDERVDALWNTVVVP